MRTNFKFGVRSMRRLKGVHPDLIRALVYALQNSQIDFGIAEGKRTLARQERLKAEGKSRTLNSRHLTGHAVDVYAWVDGAASWSKSDLREVWRAVRLAGQRLDVAVKWGGNWRNFVDAPHFALDWAKYPGL